MFGFKRGATIIGEGLKVVGNVTADGRVEIYGRLDGEVQCKSLLLSRKAHLVGAVTAEHATINGTVEGPIHAAHVRLKSRAHVVGDIHHQSLAIKKGAHFEGRSVQTAKQKQAVPQKAWKKLRSVASDADREPLAAAAQAR
jgi:cytoskeletal protein CcmA (bactofilin family)